jgi:hypothetical protein
VLQKGLHLFGGYTSVEVEAVNEAGLVHELLAGCAVGAVADQVGFDLAGDLASVSEGVHNLVNELLAFHHAHALHDAERLIREAGLGRWQSDTAGDYLRLGDR